MRSFGRDSYELLSRFLGKKQRIWIHTKLEVRRTLAPSPIRFALLSSVLLIAHMIVGLNYCSQNWGNLQRDQYNNVNHDTGTHVKAK